MRGAPGVRMLRVNEAAALRGMIAAGEVDIYEVTLEDGTLAYSVGTPRDIKAE